MKDLMELLQPHLVNPELERKKQEIKEQMRRERQEEEREQKRIRLREMVREIEKAATDMKEILRNPYPCFITIAKRMFNGEEEGMLNIKLVFSNRKVLVESYGLPFGDIKCLKRGLGIAMNQGTGIDKDIHSPCIEILHNFLSTDNVEVTYK